MSTDRFRRAALLAALGLGLHLPAGAARSAGPNELPRAVNLQQESRQAAARGQPLIVLFSRQDCRFCDQVRRDYLMPMARASARDGPVVRQVDQDRDTPLIGFDGTTISHARFASQQKIRLVPVVAFFGPDGQALGKPIVGLRLPDFYQSYLDEAISQAKARLISRAPG